MWFAEYGNHEILMRTQVQMFCSVGCKFIFFFCLGSKGKKTRSIIVYNHLLIYRILDVPIKKYYISALHRRKENLFLPSLDSQCRKLLFRFKSKNLILSFSSIHIKCFTSNWDGRSYQSLNLTKNFYALNLIQQRSQTKSIYKSWPQ